MDELHQWVMWKCKYIQVVAGNIMHNNLWLEKRKLITDIVVCFSKDANIILC